MAEDGFNATLNTTAFISLHAECLRKVTSEAGPRYLHFTESIATGMALTK